MNCPRCNSNLTAFKYEGVTLDRCGSCNGVWLDNSELEQIISKREVKFSKEEIASTISGAFSGLKKDEVDLLCPKCRTKMNKVNYAVSSGIIIDRCTSNHGIWLDEPELLKIQAYREHWESEANSKDSEWSNIAKSVKPAEAKNKNRDSILFSISRFISKHV